MLVQSPCGNVLCKQQISEFCINTIVVQISQKVSLMIELSSPLLSLKRKVVAKDQSLAKHGR